MHPVEPEELMAYLDGESASPDVANHLAACTECQTIAAEMKTVSRKLQDWQIEEPSPRVTSVLDSAQLPKPARPVWKRVALWTGGAVAACIVLMVAAAGLQMRSPRAPLPFALVQKSAQEAEAGAPSLDFVRTRAPLIIRTAAITLITPDVAHARASLEDILTRHGGHIGNLTVSAPADSGQVLEATLRVPASQLDAAVAEIRNLGRVQTEQQGGEEVTQQMVDLEARVANARNTEQRLVDVLHKNTGSITDVLAVEKEISRVRGEIERMEAERKNLADRVDFATLTVRINEEYQAHRSAPSVFGRLRNAAIEGYQNVADSLTGIAVFLLSYGPPILLWAALLFLPARYAWRKLRKSTAVGR